MQVDPHIKGELDQHAQILTTLISLILYGQYENRTVTGIVERVDSAGHQIRIDSEWIKQEDMGCVREDD